VPLLCDSRWQVAVPLTSNLKAVQNYERSSPGFLCIMRHRGHVQRSVQLPKRQRLQTVDIAATYLPVSGHEDRSYDIRLRRIRVSRAIEIAARLSLARSGSRAFITQCNQLCQCVNGYPDQCQGRATMGCLVLRRLERASEDARKKPRQHVTGTSTCALGFLVKRHKRRLRLKT
jgi:hypothetical protein